ncbi:lactate permease [Halovenus aranensis]|uniref:Lactate permease n=1 Tax=Halovenus aranensis TaxID=890420 RepID=A0A1G8XT36_9EURY|nr:L-lactate permease [Halovenus aranensis]SDJ93065.1 lactate permease [Halovenus aranensis]
MTGAVPLEAVLTATGGEAIPGAGAAGGVELLLAALPLLATAGLLVGLLWSATRAMPVAWVIALLVGFVVWGLPVDWLAASSLVGVITALEILFIVAGALVLLYTMLQAGALDRINKGFAAVSADRRVQIILLGFFMATFIEGAAGFGTPAAVVAPLLLGLGFPALAAVIAALIGHVIAVTYGAVGTPIIVGIEAPFGEGRYPDAIAEGGFEVTEFSQEVAAWAATYHALVGFVMPLIAVAMVTYFFGEEKSLQPTREVVPLALVAGISFVVPYWVSAWFITAEFPSLIGSMVGGTVTVGLLNAGYLVPDEEWEFPDRDRWADHWVGDIEPGGEEMVRGEREMSLLKAWSPYIILVVLLVVTRAVDPISDVITDGDNTVSVAVDGVGEFAFGVILEWDAILGYESLGSDIGLVNVPGFWLFLTAIAAIFIFGMSGDEVGAAWREAGQKLVAPLIALVFVISMVQVMLNAGTYYGIEGMIDGTEPPAVLASGAADIWKNANMIEVLAVATAEALGNVYPAIASLVGALGAAMTGSNTVSNLTFSQFQFTAAQQIGVPTQLVVGAQAVGGAMGNLVAIHNVVAALATVGLVGQEGRIMRLNLIPLLYYAAAVGLLTMVFSFVVFTGVF